MAFAPMPARRQGNALKIVLPLVVFAAAIAAWEAIVRIEGVPPYILPAPSLIARTLVADWSLLSGSLLTTLGTTLAGLVLAVLGGVVLAVLLSLSRIVEYSLYPFAVVLQVTPVIAIAPLLLIYMPQDVAVLACAWLVAFFPVLSNTMLGLQSVDRNLMELFQLYGAPASRGPLARLRARLKALWVLRRPAALPAFLAGLRIAGGLSLIGAVVAEMAAGSAGAGSGLAYRIIESQYRLNIPRLFAALVLLALTGIGLFLVLAALNHVLLRRWHESALDREA
ncbi:ABC transporter permease [Microvirga tunisiensis]|jgi:NitT/TauT family transport system permease protein|uniref:ABC transporter permease subunit n=1 Tax=Microvirga tunisiensis TaxID=2108360 RepID=A0A5N7MDJ0_9HYPH|nr:ABC transporter permease subunit [Microvirga tunisiensis]MPR06855.1 ABC transporter permease subunit [Microvirga tunisiensis]MPR25022.1 ABC transporter permease subunit [Microvirga tunisiensis]